MPDAEPTENPAVVLRMEDWLKRSQGRQFPYSVEILGHHFLVEAGVFSPQFYSETEFFADHVLRHIRPGDRYLDLGCGVGVTAVLAAERGAAVVALDVNPAAVANTTANGARFGVADRIDARTSDVFSALRDDERFDVMYWNVPFAYRTEGTGLDALQEAIFDPGYRKNREFLLGARRYLDSNGTVLLGASPTLGHMPTMERVAKAARLDLVCVAEERESGHTAPGPLLQLLRCRPTNERGAR